MDISIFGLGYVGVVTASILSQKHKVIGVDVNPTKVELIAQGRSPIVEKGVDELLAQGRSTGNLEATIDAEYAIKNSDLSIICVGTPSNPDGSHNLSYLRGVASQISEALKRKQQYHSLIIRSTVPPGTTEDLFATYLSGCNGRAGICFNPEFLREGNAVDDYLHFPIVVAACSDKKTEEKIRELYQGTDGKLILTNFRVAETLKVFCNIFHALKISFANEIGRFCTASGIDGQELIQIFCQDNRLNISSKYLTPGFAYGGSCLPKDLRSLERMARLANVSLPVISHISQSNEEQIAHAIRRIESCKTKNMGMVGLSFKPDTDDLRESPHVRLVEYFIGKGYDLKIYDKDVSLAKLMGANKEYIEREIPHISSLLVPNLNDLDDRELIVLNRTVEKEFAGKYVVDLR